VVARRAQVVLGLAVLVAFALASSPGQSAPGAKPTDFDKAVAAMQKHADNWLDKPGVVGVGIGENKAGKAVIHVYKVKDDDEGIPSDVDGVDVVQVRSTRFDPRASPTDRWPRPVPIGVSSGLADFATGTLGARVTNGTNVYALSNNHVFAGVNTASIGDPITQPGPDDGGSDPDDRIATLADYQEIDFNGGDNVMDAAIAVTTAGDVGTATPPDGYGAPSTTPTTATIGMGVQKYGRTTGLQQGTVQDVNLSVDVCYFPLGDQCFPGYEARYVNQISVSPGTFSAPGDSGSLMVTQGGNQPVALLFAGDGTLTIGNPIIPVLQRFNVTIDGTPAGPGPPGAPTGLSATPGDASVSLSWSAPSFDGGSAVTGYKLYRGTSPNPTNVVATLPPTPTSYPDTGLTNGTTYYYKVSAVNANGEGPASGQASATPNVLVPPSDPLPTLDNFDRGFENPLSDAGRWTNGIAGSGESGLYIPSNWLACANSTTCTAWRNNAQYGADVEVWARLSVLPGDNNQLRLLARVQQPGTAGYDGYMLRPNQLPGTDQILFERVDNGNLVPLLTVNQDLVAGDLFLLRVKGSIIEAWRQRGTTWTRLGLVVDSTYAAAGYSGVGMRGTTGRADDFGARTLGGATTTPPSAPQNLQATPGNAQVALSWSAPASDGGSTLTGYKVYRGTSPGGEDLVTPVGTPAGTTFNDVTAANGTTYYYVVKASNAVGNSPPSNEASATPVALVPPVEPRPTVDNFNRVENPLSDGGLWSNGVNGSSETGLYIPSSSLACSRSTTCTAWRNTPAQYGPDSEVYGTLSVLPGNNNQIRLYARLRQTGSSAYDGYMLRTNQLPGTDQVLLERVDNDTFTTLKTINQELVAGDVLLLRVQGSTLEAWRNNGVSWARLGLASDSTYAAAGNVGVGIRGTTGRVDDFGARTMGVAPATAPSAPQSLQATAGNAQVSLSWSAPASNGGSGLTTYTVYRSLTSGGSTTTLTTAPYLSTSFTDTTAANGTTYYYKVTASNSVGESPASNEVFSTPSAPATAPSAPQSLQATAGNAQVSLSWSAPASNGGSQVTGYRIYRSTSSGTETLLASPSGTGTSYPDTSAVNDTTYYYKVSALNAVGEGPLSNEASGTPTDLVPPVEPLAILDTFNRANENPLSFGGRWGNGILGSSERSLKVVSNQCASDRNTTATAWWKTQLGADQEAYATASTLPGNGNSVRVYARLQSPGSSAVDGYMLLFTQASGTDQVTINRITDGASTQLAATNREIGTGARLLFRAKGTALEAWVREGSVWSRIVRVTDSTYTGAGFAGIGIRGKTGRLDDFGGR
jgi:fibronectin type 3 domain-containing protein